MPTRLEVLLHRRKSAAAGLFPRQSRASASTNARPAAEKWRRTELWGIIARSYINSLTISRRQGWPVNGRADFFTMRKGPPNILFALRYSKICDNAPPIGDILWQRNES